MTTTKSLAATAAGLFTLLTVPATAQGDRSLTSSEWLAPPAREVANNPIVPRTHPAALQENVLLLRATVQELSKSLALANSEAETFKRQASELALRLDTLGLAELENNQDSLEQKLLTSVRELRMLQQRALALENQLAALTEGMVTLIQISKDMPPEIRMDLETRLRETNELLGSVPGTEKATAVESDLTNALVLDVKPELSLLIANVGSKQGVRIGTPFRVFRGSQIVGSALVVDVRERICGAIIQDLENEDNPAKQGDRLRAITR